MTKELCHGLPASRAKAAHSELTRPIGNSGERRNKSQALSTPDNLRPWKQGNPRKGNERGHDDLTGVTAKGSWPRGAAQMHPRGLAEMSAGESQRVTEYRAERPGLVTPLGKRMSLHPRRERGGAVSERKVSDEMTSYLVPMPLFLSAGGGVVWGYAFALCRLLSRSWTILPRRKAEDESRPSHRRLHCSYLSLGGCWQFFAVPLPVSLSGKHFYSKLLLAWCECYRNSYSTGCTISVSRWRLLRVTLSFEEFGSFLRLLNEASRAKKSTKFRADVDRLEFLLPNQLGLLA